MKIIILIIILWIIWLITVKIIENYRQNVRDKAAHKILDNIFNFTQEKEEILAINKKFGFVKKGEICPFCDRNLILYKPHKRFWVCSNYPNCKFIKKVN